MRKVLMPLAVIALGAGMASAQSTSDVHFEAGNYGAMLSGKVTGHEYHDYKLGAKGGQTLFVEMNARGIAYVNVLPPGSNDVAIYVGSMDDDNAEQVKLPDDGTYTLRVYLMGNDRDAGHTVSYDLDVSIQ